MGAVETLERAPGGPILEICVDDPSGLAAAVAGGADRIELCGALALGGLTPSAGLIALAARCGIPAHVMIRPRAGDFVYTESEIALMCDDIARTLAMGVAGVVVGATDPKGHPDRAALIRFRDVAGAGVIVYHRAIDLAPDPCAAVETLCALRYDHVLSSGGRHRAADGVATLAAMVRAARGRLGVIVGSGVTADNAMALIRATGVHQLHASASRTQVWDDPRIAEFGFGPVGARMTSRDHVAALRRAMGGATCL